MTFNYQVDQESGAELPMDGPLAHAQAPPVAPDRFDGPAVEEERVAALRVLTEQAIRREEGRAGELEQRERVLLKVKILWAKILPALLDAAAEQLPRLLANLGGDENATAREIAGSMRVGLERLSRSGRSPF